MSFFWSIILPNRSMTFDTENFQLISDLNPVMQQAMHILLASLTSAGWDIKLVSGKRTIQEQFALYQSGRTEPGPIKTNFPGDGSYHVWGCAVDFCPVKDGQLDWNDGEAFASVAAIAKTLGFEWGGDWQGFRDYDHIQYTQGITIEQLKMGEQLQPIEPHDPVIPLPIRLKLAQMALQNPHLLPLRKMALEKLIQRIQELIKEG